MLDPFTESSGTFLQKMEEEIWKDVPGYEGVYQASTLGQIRSMDMHIPIRGGLQLRRGRILKPIVNIDGYYTVMLCIYRKRKIWRVHKLVGITFIPNPQGFKIINHKNEIKTDNRACNLEWCDTRYNINYGDRTAKARAARKLNKRGFKPVVQMSMDGSLLNVYESVASAARLTGCHQGAISNCCIGRAKSSGNYRWRFASGIEFAGER